MNNKNIIIILLIIIIVMGISILAFSSVTNAEKILKVGDLELNMTGYDYNLESNLTTNSGGISGYTETYSVSGQGDTFSLTVMVIDDTQGIGDVGNLGTTLNGQINAVAVTKYINGFKLFLEMMNIILKHILNPLF